MTGTAHGSAADANADAVADGKAATEKTVAERLRHADLEVVGWFADASNATLLLRLRDQDPRTLADIAQSLGKTLETLHIDDVVPTDLAVYKPMTGARPLADFSAETLHLREVAAAAVAEAFGWAFVPATVLRQDAPFGVGSLQQFIAHDRDQDYFTLYEAEHPSVIEALQAMVIFDLLVNNADRKAGHVLARTDGGSVPIALVDHGLAFHADDKLRTVAWDFVDQPISERLHDDVARVREALDRQLGQALTELLDTSERDALAIRAEQLASLTQFPAPPTDRRPFPWPLY